MADDALHAEMERLKAENAALKAQATRGISMKVSEKGGVSVYGLGRFPVTLYKEQWTKLLDLADDIRAFSKAHDSELNATEPRCAARSITPGGRSARSTARSPDPGRTACS